MQKDGLQVRFHSLDALRAWAMLLGIVLHAAWIMASDFLYSPITDVDGGWCFDYLFSFIHMFRMQVFFLMAGFFAHLVFSKRGHRGFIWHRLSRIAVPLIIGWLLLCPIMTFQYAWGGLTSGRILSSDGLGKVFLDELIMGSLFNPTNFYHLWFLYDLLLVYALALLFLLLLDKVLDRRGVIRKKVNRGFRWLVRSPWNVFVLAVPSAFFLYFDTIWWGLKAIPVWFIPVWSGFLGYCLFFAFGWLLFAHWDLLAELGSGWRKKLVIGTVLSIPVFVAASYFSRDTPPMYPVLTHAGIRSHEDLVAVSGIEAQSNPLNPKVRVWRSLSPRYQQFLVAHDELTSDQVFGLAMELNKTVIFNSEFSDPDKWRDVELPDDAAAMLADESYHHGIFRTARLNRRLLEVTFPNMINTDVLSDGDVKLTKAAFSAVYAVAMWLLVFGLIGFFNSQFNEPSSISRYIADSAYWVYLIHLPIMFQCQVLVADQSWGFFGIPKFLFYNIVTALLCFVSYHYLVRSTFVGRILNGRKYPFVPWFRR